MLNGKATLEGGFGVSHKTEHTLTAQPNNRTLYLPKGVENSYPLPTSWRKEGLSPGSVPTLPLRPGRLPSHLDR